MLEKSLIKTAIQEHQNKVIPMNYTLADKNLIKRFRLDSIKNGSSTSFYGHINEFNPETFLAGLGTNTKADVSHLVRVIQGIARDVCDAYSRKHVWVSIRVRNKATDAYDIARWHQDGNFFTNPKSRSAKHQQSNFITILKGAGTLMIDPHPSREVLDKIKQHKRKLYLEFKEEADKGEFKNYFAKQNSKEFRKEYDKLLAGETKKQLANDEGLVFMVGNDNTALIHSEPPMHEDRIFIKILPGYAYEIQELQERFNRF